ncbi:hypothetical protein NXW10_16920 [Bacteroides fragilis]|nr:hypothetical protein NXW10_16920 [Bacteroides fragilis]
MQHDAMPGEGEAQGADLHLVFLVVSDIAIDAFRQGCGTLGALRIVREGHTCLAAQFGGHEN